MLLTELILSERDGTRAESPGQRRLRRCLLALDRDYNASSKRERNYLETHNETLVSPFDRQGSSRLML